MSTMKSSDENRIQEVARRINVHWMNKQYDRIGELVAEDVVVAPPGFEMRVMGREAFVQSFRDYDREATTHEFNLGETKIDIIGDTAVAITPFDVVYELQEISYREEGNEMLVLSLVDGRWKVVWRTVLTESSEEIE